MSQQRNTHSAVLSPSSQQRQLQQARDAAQRPGDGKDQPPQKPLSGVLPGHRKTPSNIYIARLDDIPYEDADEDEDDLLSEESMDLFEPACLRPKDLTHDELE